MRSRLLTATIALAVTATALAIPSPGILHGFVQTQAGAPVTDHAVIVTHLKGMWPFNATPSLTETGEFVVSPNVGTYLVEIRDGDEVVDSGEYNIFSNITTFAFFTVYTPDTNGDQLVDVNDLITVISTWGDCPGGFELCPGDTNGDDVVDVTDLVNVFENWS